ncbi:MAG: Rid family detoxifying hydrolase [Gammaproteobacteria bacterium]|nr:Rid family detoxifying hydrolase [Gammaproteobacteria bacterium]
MKQIIATSAAPAAIGTYSQAVAAGNCVYLSGQIGLDPQSMELVADNLELQLHQVFRNLAAVCAAAGGSLADLVKLNVYLLDMADFATVNQIMAEHVPEPFPARAALAVSGLPKGARVEIDGVMLIPQQRGD